MSAIDWTPGPRLRAAMDADQALTHMQRDELGDAKARRQKMRRRGRR